jgi:hypothetical protein
LGWLTDTVKGRCPLRLGEEDAKRMLLDCKETKHWRMKLIHDKWLNMSKEVACRKMVKVTRKAHIKIIRQYSDIVKNNWLNKIKEM